MVVRDRERGVDRAVRGRQRARPVAPVGVERSAEQIGELAAGRERVDDRQRVDAFDEVLARGLAERLVARRQVEAVVDDLEAQTEVEAVTRVSASSVGSSTPLTMPPMRQDVAKSEAVLPSIADW